MTKKDITFIKYIKPQVKAKEAIDKGNSRNIQYRKALEHTGLTPGITIEDLALAFPVWKKLRGEKK